VICVSPLSTNYMPPLKSPRIVCFFASTMSCPILHLDVLLAVAHHSWMRHDYVIFFALKIKRLETLFSLLNLRILKFVEMTIGL
jgi:hypothetical protein